MLSEKALLEYAAGLLARREYSELGLKRKLFDRLRKAHQKTDEDLSGEDLQIVEVIAERLKDLGYLSDERYLVQWIRAHYERYGSLKMIHELSAQGISRRLLDRYHPLLIQHDLITAYRLWQRKFKTLPATPKEKHQQQQFLLQRGLPFDILHRLFRSLAADEIEMALQEAENGLQEIEIFSKDPSDDQ